MPLAGMARTQAHAEHRDRLRAVVNEAKSRPCVDCGEEYPYWVMDLDHSRGEKSMGINAAIGRLSLQDLLVELAKCDPVCANCHRDRTYRRGYGATKAG